MDFVELISDFGERHGIANLVAEDNSAALDIDGILVTLVAASDVLSAAADIGEPPVEGRGDFAELLLEANLQSEAFFSKDPVTGSYILVRRLSLPALDGEAFDAALESLVNQAETWRRLLADYRPVANAVSEKGETLPQFGASGFVQV